MGYEHIAAAAEDDNNNNNNSNGMRLTPLVLLFKMDLWYQSLKVTKG